MTMGLGAGLGCDGPSGGGPVANKADAPKPCAGLGSAVCEHFVLECAPLRKLADRAIVEPNDCKEALGSLAEVDEAPEELRMALAVEIMHDTVVKASNVSATDMDNAMSRATNGLTGPIRSPF